MRKAVKRKPAVVAMIRVTHAGLTRDEAGAVKKWADQMVARIGLDRRISKRYAEVKQEEE